MKVKVLNPFRDVENDLQLRKIGDIYECSEERANILASKGFVALLGKKEAEKPAVEAPEAEVAEKPAEVEEAPEFKKSDAEDNEASAEVKAPEAEEERAHRGRRGVSK